MKRMVSAFAILMIGCEPKIDIGFSPHGGCTEKVVNLLDRAEHSIYVQAYSFTSDPIGDALIRAHARGIPIQLILDRVDVKAPHSLLPVMKQNHIPTLIDKKHPIAHNKVVIVDSRWVETGSFNYSEKAESNAENCLVIDDEDIAAKYLANWETHKTHSE